MLFTTPDGKSPDQKLLRAQAFRAMARMLVAHEFSSEDPWCFVHFNLENFKGFNEKFGHSAGDELLEFIGSAIQACFPGQPLTRSSADHFELVTPYSTVIPGVKRVRSLFRSRIKDSSIWLKAGYYLPERADEDINIIADRAKQANDAIKGRRDRYYREYDEELRQQIATRQFVLDNFDDALANGHIKAYYQPIVHVASGRVCDEEALSRWEDPERGIIYPNEFIPVLEDARLIHMLDLNIVRQACRDIKRLQAHEGLTEIPPISVNLSRLDFELCDIVSEIEEILAQQGIPHKALSIEITESALTGNSEFLKGEIDRFRNDGFEVWMDDFGSGYSSLNLLKEYKFDLVKIDMEFLKDFDAVPETRVLVASVINLLKELGFKTLVEGVEGKEQYEFLRALGCGRAQGYLLGHPESMDSMLERLDAGSYPPIETAGGRSFYSLVAHVNLMRPTPTKGPNGEFIASDYPVATAMRRKGTWTYLNATDVYHDFLAQIGAKTLEESAARMNDPTRVEYMRINEALEQALASRDWEWTTYFESGKYCTMRIKVIAEDRARDMVAVLLLASSLQESKLINPTGFFLQ